MIGSEKVRAARKKQQQARLAAKKKSKGNDYAEYFAKLPKQMAKAQVNEKIRGAYMALKQAIETLLIAEETGEDLLGAQEAAQVAELYLQKLKASKLVPTAAVLTAAGGAST